MINALCIDKSNDKSATMKFKKLKFLPRFGFTFELGGRKISYRQVPLLETLLNLKDRGFSKTNLMKVAMEQLQEVNLSDVKTPKC